MKIKRVYITITIYLILLISSYIIFDKLDIIIFSALVSFLLIGTMFFFKKQEIKKIIKKFTYYTDNNKLEEGIKYITSIKNKTFFFNSDSLCDVLLVHLYMRNDQLEEVRKILASNPKINDTMDLYYINFIISVNDKDAGKIIYYFKKLYEVTLPSYDKTKDSAKRILMMIKTKEKDEELYNITVFPLVKKICDNLNDYQDFELKNEISQEEIKNDPILKDKKQIIKIILNTLSILSIFIAGMIVSIIVNQNNIVSSLDRKYYILKNLWIFILFIPIPIFNFIYSIYLNNNQRKYKSNMIISIIMIILLSIVSIETDNKNFYSFDKNYLNQIEEKINIDFPNNFNIISLDLIKEDRETNMEKYVTFRYEENNLIIESKAIIKKESIITFDSNSKINLENYWIDKEYVSEYISTFYIFEEKEYDKYLVYCLENSEYNPTIYNKEMNYIICAYDEESSSLFIKEFFVE